MTTLVFLKNKLMDYFKKFEFKDFGTNSEESVDYLILPINLQMRFQQKTCQVFLFVEAGGMSMVANRYNNVRAALCFNENMAKLSRQHNNANILVLGSRLISYGKLLNVLLCF